MNLMEELDNFNIDQCNEETNKRQLKINKVHQNLNNFPQTTPRKVNINEKELDIYSNAHRILNEINDDYSLNADSNRPIYENNDVINFPTVMKPLQNKLIPPSKLPPPQPTVITSKDYDEENDKKLIKQNSLNNSPKLSPTKAINKVDIKNLISEPFFPSDIRDFIQTEILYCEILEDLEKNYIKRLLELSVSNGDDDSINTYQLKDLFEEILAIIKIHTSSVLPSALKHVKNNSAPETFIKVYRTVTSALKLYSLYHQKFLTITKKIEYWSNLCVEFSSVINGLDNINEIDQSFIDCLIKPFYRIKQYKSLFKAFIREHIRTENEITLANELLMDYSKLTKAIKKTTILDDANRKATILQKKIGDQFTLITPNRKIIKHGAVKKLTAKTGEKLQAYLILTTDYLLHCSKSANLFKVEHMVDLKTATISHDLNQNCFIFRIRSREMAEEFMVNSENERKMWVKILQRSVGCNERDHSFVIGKMAPIWTKDDSSMICKVCSSKFSTIKRRHHCRACGDLVCATCSDNREPLEYDNYTKHRVCDTCKSQLKMNLLSRK